MFTVLAGPDSTQVQTAAPPIGPGPPIVKYRQPNSLTRLKQFSRKVRLSGGAGASLLENTASRLRRRAEAFGMTNYETSKGPQPRYAVVIPTRNRQAYAVEAVETVIAAGDGSQSGLEIILADASDDARELPARIAGAGLSDRVRILAPDAAAMDMQANWERALAATTAQYVIFIGDDDGLAPDALDTLDALIEAAPAPVYAWDPVDYRWPCFPTAGRGRLAVSLAPPALSLANAKQSLARHFTWQTRAKWPEIGPSIYHGAVRRDVIDCVRQSQGAYFSSFIVDYASAIANAALIDRFVHVSAPLSILGSCGRSNSAALTGVGEAAERKRETAAANPDLAPIFPELADSGLWAPLVARGYALSFARLGLTFEPSPRRLLESCVAEMGFLMQEAAFEQARRSLLAFAERRALDAERVRQARFVEDAVLVGAPAGQGRFFLDTVRLGWRGVADAARGLRAVAPGLGETPAERRAALASVAAHFANAAGAGAKAA